MLRGLPGDGLFWPWARLPVWLFTLEISDTPSQYSI
jgi:hypothetical protein